MITVIAIALNVALWLPLAMLYAWALQTLWGWYAVPIFGLPFLSYGAAMGVGLVVQFLTRGIPNYHSERPAGDKAWDFAGCITRPIFVVGAGWVYLQLWPLS